ATTLRSRGVPRRVFDAGLGEALLAKQTAVAAPARFAPRRRVVAGVRVRVVDARREAQADDLGLLEPRQRRVNLDARALDARLRRAPGEPLERANELGPAVGVAAVVDGVHSDEDVYGAHDFAQPQREAEEEGVACGHVGHGDALAHRFGAAALRHGE